MQKFHSIILLALFWSCFSSAQIPTFMRPVPPDVEVVENLTYAQYEDYSLQLDLYRPAGSEAILPAIVVIREGGLGHGDKEFNAALAAGLAQQNFVAVSIEYRGASEEVFPASVHDTKAAVRWLRANADTYRINPAAIGAMGGSWGAYLSVYSGLTGDIPELEGEGGSTDASSALDAMVGLSTPVDMTDFPGPMESYLGQSYEADPALWNFASTVSHVSEDSPPLLLIASQADTTVPFSQSLELTRLYGENGLDVELVLIPDLGHSFWYFEGIFEQTVLRAADFFHRHLDTL